MRSLSLLWRQSHAANQEMMSDEIRALADRIVVVYEGELTGSFDPVTATVEEIAGPSVPASCGSEPEPQKGLSAQLV